MNDKINFNKEKLTIFTKSHEELTKLYKLIENTYTFKTTNEDTDEIYLCTDFIEIQIKIFRYKDSNIKRLLPCNTILTDKTMEESLPFSKFEFDCIATMYDWVMCTEIEDLLDRIKNIYNKSKKSYENIGG